MDGSTFQASKSQLLSTDQVNNNWTVAKSIYRQRISDIVFEKMKTFLHIETESNASKKTSAFPDGWINISGFQITTFTKTPS